MAQRPKKKQDNNNDRRIGHPKLRTIREASEKFGLTQWTIRNCIWNGTLPFVKFPHARKYWLRDDDMEKLIETHRQRILY